jgi:hypothetical protein
MTIPTGWRRLSPHETIIDGDKFWDDDLEEWMMCRGSIGETPSESFDDGTAVIRKSEPAKPATPAEEKIWVDPWD